VTTNEQIWAYNRALDFLQGMNMPKDLEKSFALNAKAANVGYREAILAVGWYYLGGVGVERDLEKAKNGIVNQRDLENQRPCSAWEELLLLNGISKML
jgi:hypothetical protein